VKSENEKLSSATRILHKKDREATREHNVSSQTLNQHTTYHDSIEESKVKETRLAPPFASGFDFANVMIGCPLLVTWHRRSVSRGYSLEVTCFGNESIRAESWRRQLSRLG
jgi:hypothetical protein